MSTRRLRDVTYLILAVMALGLGVWSIGIALDRHEDSWGMILLAGVFGLAFGWGEYAAAQLSERPRFRIARQIWDFLSLVGCLVAVLVHHPLSNLAFFSAMLSFLVGRLAMNRQRRRVAATLRDDE